MISSFPSCTWVLLASQLPEVLAKVLSLRFPSLISVFRSNNQLSSLQELAPLLFTLCKRFTSLSSPCAAHLSLVGVSPTEGTSLVTCNFLEWIRTILFQFSHTQTLLHILQHANLSPDFIICYTLPSKVSIFQKSSILSALKA